MLTRQCNLQDGNRVSTSVLLSVFSSTFADLGVRGEMELVSSVDTTWATTSLAPQLIGVVTGTYIGRRNDRNSSINYIPE